MTEAPAPPRRSQAIDVARAAAIVGVASNHSIDGLLGAGLIPTDHPLETVNAALYLFRMPALAFLLGLFIPRAVTKRGVTGYLRERATLMLYLYLVWFVLQGVAETATSGLKNTPRDTGSLWTVWITFAHLWFLPFLVVTSVVLALSQPWRSPVRRLVVAVTLVPVTLLTWGWNSDVIGLTGLSLLAFAAAGSMIGLPRLARWLSRSVWGWTGVGVTASVVLVLLLRLDVAPSTVPADVALGDRVVSLAAAVVGTVALLAVAVLLARVPGVRALLAAIGRKTLPIYLAHVIVVAGVRVAMTRAGIEEPWLIVAVAVPLGVGLPLAAASFAEGRPWASWAFDLPAALKRRTQPPAAGTSDPDVLAPARREAAVAQDVAPARDTTAAHPRSSAAGAHRLNTARTAAE